MVKLDEFKQGLIKVFAYALLSLFLIPACTLWFVDYAQSSHDAALFERIDRAIDNETSLPPSAQSARKEYFRQYAPSKMCRASDPSDDSFRARFCPPYSELWQYIVVEKVAKWALAGGAVVLAAILILGGIAFVNRQAQYISFVVGWNMLRVASTVEVLIQGALLTWLSFWVTAFFFNRYFPKIIFIAGLLTGGAAFYAIVGIFRRIPKAMDFDGELISREDAPLLWAHIEDRAKQLNTRPPEQIVTGIDANFFVTESPLIVKQQILKGRSLFVSLPLLRIMDRREADAVLAHELAHFSGGDTANSAALGPKLVQFDYYCALMRNGGSTIAVFYIITLYRVIFEFALRRDSREREFRADRIAANLETPHAVLAALIKVAAYANYRSRVEQELFEHGSRHENQLGIAARISAGLNPYASSQNFMDSMRAAGVPHPFDSHPPIVERMRNVGLMVEEKDYSWIVTRIPKSTWVMDIQNADALENRLWNDYEQQFTSQHEISLAYRYEPANEAELAIVLKHFPPIVFNLRGNKQIGITFKGLELPNHGEISWDRMSDLKYTDGIAGDVLELIHPDKGVFGSKKTKVRLPGIRKRREEFKQTLARYYHRHGVMRERISRTSHDGDSNDA